MQCASANAHILTLTEPTILGVVYLAVPELIGIINDAHFTLILVNHEELDDLNLDVKIIVSIWALW